MSTVLMSQCACVHWSCWQQWRGWCKPAVATFYAVLLVVAIPLLIYHLTSSPNHIKLVVWFVAGLFVLLTLPIFLVGLVQHILNYTQPHLQKHIIRYSCLLDWVGVFFSVVHSSKKLVVVGLFVLANLLWYFPAL